MPRRPGAPTLGERARKVRITRGLTQHEAGGLIGKSQAYVSQLEKNLHPDEVHAYLNALRNASSKARTAGGLYKAGRARGPQNGLVDPTTFRGEALQRGFDHAAALPKGRGWRIIAICRTAPKTELAFLRQQVEEGSSVFGIVGFHLVDGEMKRSRVIRVTEEYDEAASAALVAFAEDSIGSEDGGDDEDAEDNSADDDFLADDEG